MDDDLRHVRQSYLSVSAHIRAILIAASEAIGEVAVNNNAVPVVADCRHRDAAWVGDFNRKVLPVLRGDGDVGGDVFELKNIA
jgi:hypothetical protein